MDEIINISNVHFIGTSHISKDSIKEINDYVGENSPEIIAVELDIVRLKALLEDKPSEIKLFNFKMLQSMVTVYLNFQSHMNTNRILME